MSGIIVFLGEMFFSFFVGRIFGVKTASTTGWIHSEAIMNGLTIG